MRRALLLLLLGAVAGAEERVFLETETPRDAYFVHEPILLRLRVGFDRQYFEQSVVPMFRRDLDVQLKVSAPWLEELDGTLLRGDETPPGARLSFALNDEIFAAPRVADRLRDGRSFTVLEIVRTFVPLRPGELVIPAPELRFAYGTRFKEDFLSGRVAIDRRDAFVNGKPLELTISALPEAQRPPGFSGAVGRGFSVRAEASPRDLEAGATCKLVLSIGGEGNLELFDTPRLGALSADDFHVYGMIDDRGATRRTVTYDLAPLHARVAKVPSILFSYFDTEARGYRTVKTEPIPLTVRGGAPAAKKTAPPRRRGLWLLFVIAPLAVLLLALLLRRWTRRRGVPEAGPAETFLARAGTDPAAAFTEYLAARLDRPTASVIAPDLPARLASAGVPAELAARAAALLERLVGARYGGAASDAGAVAAARALVDDLEASFESE